MVIQVLLWHTGPGAFRPGHTLFAYFTLRLSNTAVSGALPRCEGKIFTVSCRQRSPIQRQDAGCGNDTPLKTDLHRDDDEHEPMRCKCLVVSVLAHHMALHFAAPRLIRCGVGCAVRLRKCSTPLHALRCLRPSCWYLQSVGVVTCLK